VVAGVLNNSVGSSEGTKLVREVTEIYVHEEFNEGILINDIAILKVGIIFKYEK
jgi:secreted trypsin-like serine protease